MIIYERTLSLDEAADELELIMSAARQLNLSIEICSVQLGGITREVEYRYRVRIWGNPLIELNDPVGINSCTVAAQLGNAL